MLGNMIPAMAQATKCLVFVKKYLPVVNEIVDVWIKDLPQRQPACRFKQGLLSNVERKSNVYNGLPHEQNERSEIWSQERFA